MKKRNKLRAAFAAGACLLIASCANATPQNTINNGDFETIKDNRAAAWSVTQKAGLIESGFPEEKGQGHIAEIRLLKWDAGGAYVSQSISVKPHMRYQLSLKARMNTGNIRIALSGGDGDEKVNITKIGRSSQISMYPLFWDESWSPYIIFTPNEWRTVTIDFNSGNASKIYLSMGGYQRAGVYSFDDISLVEMGNN